MQTGCVWSRSHGWRRPILGSDSSALARFDRLSLCGQLSSICAELFAVGRVVKGVEKLIRKRLSKHVFQPKGTKGPY